MYISLRSIYMGYSIYMYLYRTVAGQAQIVTILPICCEASTQAPCQANLLRAHLFMCRPARGRRVHGVPLMGTARAAGKPALASS